MINDRAMQGPIYATNPGLVYETSYQDYLLYMCASAGVQMDSNLTSPKNPLPAYALNCPSIAIARLNGTVSLMRTVTHVARGKARYRVSIVDPDEVSVAIQPGVLKFKCVGEKKSFEIVLKDTRSVV